MDWCCLFRLQPEPIALKPTSQEIVNSFATVSGLKNSTAIEATVGEMVIERSISPPPPPSSASSGFSDDDSLHFDDGRGLTLEEFARHVKSKGKQGLYAQYAEIKGKGTDGTFNHAR